MGDEHEHSAPEAAEAQPDPVPAAGGMAAAWVGSGPLTTRGALALQATAGNRRTAALLARQRLARAPQQRPQRPLLDPLVIAESTFDDAARAFAKILADAGERDACRIVVINGDRIHVYDEKGGVIPNATFRFVKPADIPAGVFRKAGSRDFSAILRRPDGSYTVSDPVRLEHTVNINTDVDDRERYAKAVQDLFVYVVVPTAKLEGVELPQQDQKLPEFMQFEPSSKKANLQAYPLDVKPVAPPSMIATVHSSTTFLAEVTKTRPGGGLLDNVTNLMEPTNFRWEVLKLDQSLQNVTGKRRVTNLDEVGEGYARRLRQLEDDRQTLYGDHPERQSAVGRAVRQSAADQLIEARQSLAVVGQTALTIVHTLIPDTSQPNVQDYMDVPWDEPGDYFVRCLATPVHGDNAKYIRATSVAGVMVSVYDPAELAQAVMPSPEQEAKDAAASIDSLKKQLEELKDGPGTDLRRASLNLEIAFRQKLIDAKGEPTARYTAELELVRGELDLLQSSPPPTPTKQDQQALESQIKRLQAREAELQRILEAPTKRLATDYKRIGLMSGALIDEDTGQPQDLVFAVGERRLVNQPETEIVIQDVTSPDKGRLFSGRGDGVTQRTDAWEAALGDLRRNLGRGRGLLAWRAPAAYAGWPVAVPNPMKLQVATLDQLKETVDDAANAATLVALLAAVPTGGASLELLAVLGPIAAASSLYNIVNRSAYNDLELDEATIMDVINVASLGLGHLSQVESASKSMQLVATTSKVAVKVFTYGQFAVMTWTTYRQIFGPSPPGEDPRAGRRRRLLALLNLMQAAAIPVAEHLWPPGTRAIPERGGQRENIPGADESKLPSSWDKKPAPKPQPGDHGRAADTPTTRPRAVEAEKGLPLELRRSVPVEIDHSLSGSTVEVHYEIDLRTGMVKDVRMRVSKDATAQDVALHAKTAETMLRYSGLSGRIRLLWLDLLRLVGSNEPEVGTKAWEAKLELEKLPEVIKDRVTRLAKPDLTAAQREELIDDLGALEAQVREHSLTIEEMNRDPGAGHVDARSGADVRKKLTEAQKRAKDAGLPDPEAGYHWRYREGRWEYIGSGGRPNLRYDPATKTFSPAPRTAPPEVEFPAGTSKEAAFTKLGGDDVTRDFGRWVKVVVEVLGIHSRAELIDRLDDPSGVKPRTVRGWVKDLVDAEIVAALRDPVRLKATDTYKRHIVGGASEEAALAAASQAEMQRVTRLLAEGDRGSIGEAWYKAQFAPEAKRQVAVPGSRLPSGEDRKIDLLGDGTLREIKNVAGRLNEGDEEQIDDFIDLLGTSVTLRDGSAQMVDHVQVAFLDPRGVWANRQYMREVLGRPGLRPTDVSFEIVNDLGDRLIVTPANSRTLSDAALAAWLPIKRGSVR